MCICVLPCGLQLFSSVTNCASEDLSVFKGDRKWHKAGAGAAVCVGGPIYRGAIVDYKGVGIVIVTVWDSYLFQRRRQEFLCCVIITFISFCINRNVQNPSITGMSKCKSDCVRSHNQHS